MRPRIGIPVPTSFDHAYNDLNWSAYARAVEEAGGEAIGIPLDLADPDLKAVMNDCDGYLLPGSGADIAPEKYGQEKQLECNQQDTGRERVDWALLQSAEEEKKPTLCICFGTQSLNVFRGGTLMQHLAPMPVNHSAGRSVAVAHTIVVSPESVLGRIVDTQEAKKQNDFLRLSINSSHHQAIAIPGEGLRVTARSTEDGVIEAVEGDPEGPFLIGVQWHPERTRDISPTSRAIFTRFVEEARKAARV